MNPRGELGENIREELIALTDNLIDICAENGYADKNMVYKQSHTIFYYSSICKFMRLNVLDFSIIESNLMDWMMDKIRLLKEEENFPKFREHYEQVTEVIREKDSPGLLTMMVEVILYLFSEKQIYGAFVFSDFIVTQYDIYKGVQ